MSPLFSLATPSALSVRIVLLKFATLQHVCELNKTQHRCLILYVTAGFLYFIINDKKREASLL